jgi:hypothetical protein
MVIKRYENGKLCLVIEIDEERKKSPRPTIEKQDRAAGYRDRIYGMYNDWYRNNRADGGRAYDLGQSDADREPYTDQEVTRRYV